MKKTILFALMVVGLTVSFFVGITVSQERRAAIDDQKARNEFQIQQAQKAFETVQQRDRARFGFIDVSQDSKSQRLRKELLQLFEKHLHSMNDEELNAGIAQLRKELGEHEAKAKLQRAEKLLQEILKTYPKSQAAKQARRMLETQRGSEEAGATEADPAATLPDESVPEKTEDPALDEHTILKRQVERAKAEAEKAAAAEKELNRFFEEFIKRRDAKYAKALAERQKAKEAAIKAKKDQDRKAKLEKAKKDQDK